MKQTELEIKYLKNETGINLNAYDKQRNSVLTFQKRTERRL